MATPSDDMDALDSLLAETLGMEDIPAMSSNEAPSAKEAQKAATPSPVSAQATTTAPNTDKDLASVWTEVIEKASGNMQDSARMAQQATQKNIELAKQQNQGIKELAEASHGWRNLARQTYEEVMTAKKGILTMTVSVIFAVITGAGLTTAFTWYQGNDAQHQSHLLKETVEEYHQDMRKTLAVKLDEMNGLIEQIPTQTPIRDRQALINLEQESVAAETEATLSPSAPDHGQTTELIAAQAESIANLEGQLGQVLRLLTQQQSQQEQLLAQIAQLQNTNSQPTSAAPVTAPVSAKVTPDPTIELIGQKLAQTQQAISQLDGKLDGKLTSLEQSLSQLKTDMKAWQESSKTEPSPSKALTDQMTKLQKELSDIKQMQQAIKEGRTTSNATQDRALVDQIAKLQRDIREIKQQQLGIKDQVQDVKQNLPAPQPQPYQYRLETERYPR